MCCNNYFINDYMFANSALIMITGFEHLAKAGLQTSPAKGRPSSKEGSKLNLSAKTKPSSSKWSSPVQRLQSSTKAAIQTSTKGRPSSKEGGKLASPSKPTSSSESLLQKVSVFKFEFDKYGLGYILTLV